jgi:3-deoxy-D-manno-octulosonate 8-phosphate phosphatase (KDO 8-P phosphatase)
MSTPDFSRIRRIAFDYDGVFTNGTILLLPDGSQVRQATVRDGYAVQWAAKQQVPISLITGGREESVRMRMNGLGVTDVHLGSANKLEVVTRLCETEWGIDLSELAYMGDDLPDLPVLEACGLSLCPADAVPEVLSACHYVSPKGGGAGCVRDVLEWMMKEREIWHADGLHHW